MKKTWTYRYGGSKIEVINTWTGGCWLLVNDQTRDINNGIVSGSLRTTLENGEEILAKVGQGLLGIKCRLYVNGREVKPAMINGKPMQTGAMVPPAETAKNRKIRKCTNCGAKVRSDTCEYCGEEVE